MNPELLSLRQTVRFLAVPHIQQFQGADLVIGAQADIQPDHILLVQWRFIQRFKTQVILVHQVGVPGSRRPYLCSPVADIEQFEFGTAMEQAFLCDVLGLVNAFDEPSSLLLPHERF